RTARAEPAADKIAGNVGPVALEGLHGRGDQLAAQPMGPQFGPDVERTVAGIGAAAHEEFRETGIVLPALPRQALHRAGGLIFLHAARGELAGQLPARVLPTHQQAQRALHRSGRSPWLAAGGGVGHRSGWSGGRQAQAALCPWTGSRWARHRGPGWDAKRLLQPGLALRRAGGHAPLQAQDGNGVWPSRIAPSMAPDLLDREPLPAGASLTARRREAGRRWFRTSVLAFLGGDLGGLELLAQFAFQALGHFRVLAQVLAGVVLALADALGAVAVPGAGLVHELGIHAHVDQFALAADALAVEDLGDDLLE